MKIRGTITHVETANSKKGDKYQKYSVLVDGTSLLEVLQMGDATHEEGDEVTLDVKFKAGRGFETTADIRLV
jgi:hypothetical protein